MNLFDLHADTPLFLNDNIPTAVDMLNHPFKCYTQTMAIFIRDNDTDGFKIYNERLNAIKKYSSKHNIPLIKQKGIPLRGIMLSVENAGFLAENPERLYKLYSDGVRMLSLTWNGDNPLASGVGGEGGISKKGKEVIKIMNSLGMPLDISHLSHQAALEGCELANRVLASHSCLYSLYPHRRNLKDEVLKLLKEKDGVIGLCFYPEFLGSADVTYKLKEHIDYLLNMGMENNICFGSDFDGAEMSPELSKTADIPELFTRFIGFGLKKSLMNRIFYENAIAFFSKMCENK